MIDEQVFGALDLGFLEEEAGAVRALPAGPGGPARGQRALGQHPLRQAGRGQRRGQPRQVRAARHPPASTVKEPSEELINDFLALSKDEKLTREARNEAALAVARLRYERKDYTGALEAYTLVKLPELDPGRATPLPGGGVDALQAGRAARLAGHPHHAGRAVLPRRVPAGQVPAARPHLPGLVPLPARQARRQGAHAPLRGLAGGHRRARGPDAGPAPAPRRRRARRHPARRALQGDAGAGVRAPGPLRRQLRRPAHRRTSPSCMPCRWARPSASTRRGWPRPCARKPTPCCAPPSRCA